MSDEIQKPNGKPFDIVGSDEAREAIEKLEDWAESAMYTGDDRQRVWNTSSAVYSVLAHRDHLAAQVTELQASNTALLMRAREAEQRK